jgi:hypothetical protein
MAQNLGIKTSLGLIPTDVRSVAKAGGEVLLVLFLVLIIPIIFVFYATPDVLMLSTVGSFVLAFGLPVLLISVRHSVRLTRIRMIQIFQKNFDIPTRAQKENMQSNNEPAPEENASMVSSFEFVVGKYVHDIPQVKDFTAVNINQVPLRGGSVCLNSPGQFYKWFPPLVMPQPGLAAAH